MFETIIGLVILIVSALLTALIFTAAHIADGQRRGRRCCCCGEAFATPGHRAGELCITCADDWVRRNQINKAIGRVRGPEPDAMRSEGV